MSESQKMKFEAEYTDTFGGEANYAWVKRVEFELPECASDLAVVRKAKTLLGLGGLRCRKDCLSGDDTITLRPSRSNTVIFITPIY